MGTIHTVEDFQHYVREIETQVGYRPPLAFGVGLARCSAAGNVLDTFFPFPNYNSNFGSAAVLAKLVGHLSGTNTYDVDYRRRNELLDVFHPFLNDGKVHGNIDAIQTVFDIWMRRTQDVGDDVKIVVSFIDHPEHDQGPQTVSDAYLRLHLLSHRLVKPGNIKLDGIFGKLPNNIWTNEGPIAPEDFPHRQAGALMTHQPLHVNAVDKFPRMVDYVVPSGVRIADASRVRLGAYLGEGTTIMHEGFCNFNAGTMGASMIEGRISAGVIVGAQTDIGGGASIMGVLSGGGKEKIRIGRGCLLGANAGTGISLGDRCVIEAGLYVTAGVPVVYHGQTVKAGSLSGKDELTFRRNGMTGIIEVLDQANPVELNEMLHQN